MAISTKVGTITTATGSVILPMGGEPQGSVMIYGTYGTFTAKIQGSTDGVHYADIQVLRANTWEVESGSQSPPDNTSRLWYFNAGPLTHVQIIASALSTGTVNVVMNNSPGSTPIFPTTQLQFVTNAGKTTGTILAGTAGSNTIVTAAPCILDRVSVTTAGTASLILYDNATTNSGTIVFASPATYALGTITEVKMPCLNGITARLQSGSAACTVSYTTLNN